MAEEFRNAAERNEAEIIAVRRRLHQSPELSYHESQTAALISETLSRWGIRHRTGIGGNGIVADIGGEHPRVAVRADMDALPIRELSKLPFCSRIPGTAHLCGHDAHMAMALGAARLLAERLEADGNGVRFIFQPAEELPPGGAEAMMEGGALEGIRSMIALHVAPLPVGVFGIRKGALTASVDHFRVTVAGKGCHGAAPHLGIDPVVVSAQMILAFQTLISRAKNPLEPAVLSICRVRAGEQYNIIPEEAEMEGTLRCFSPIVRDGLLTGAGEIVRSISEAYGAHGKWELLAGHDSVLNDEEIADRAVAVLKREWNDKAMMEIPPQTFGEDFANYGKKAKTFMALLGAGPAAILHSPHFELDESALKEGAAFLASLAWELRQ